MHTSLSSAEHRELNVFIAEACDWTFSSPQDEDTTLPYFKTLKEEAIGCWVKPGGGSWQRETLPDFCGSLDAILPAFHYFRGKLDPIKKVNFEEHYFIELCVACTVGLPIAHGFCNWEVSCPWITATATAYQHAVAFRATVKHLGL